MKRQLKMLAAATAMTTLFAGLASAGGILRFDEAPPGELDPAKASDYNASVLMFNVYDTLVAPAQGKTGYVPDLAKSWTDRKSTRLNSSHNQRSRMPSSA